MTRFHKAVLTSALVLLVGGAARVETVNSTDLLGRVTGSTTQLANRLLKPVLATLDGALGGVVQGERWTVTVPRGAYTGVARLSLLERAEGVVDLGISPESLNHFTVPVKLQYTRASAAEDISNKSIYWWNPETSAWEPAPGQSGDVVKGTLTATLPHFSTYRVQGGRAGW